MKYVGAHVSISGGVENAPLNAGRIGAKAFAMYTKNQRQWHARALSEESIEQFKKNLKEVAIEPKHVLPHDSYLINLGHPEAEKLQKSREAFVDDLISRAVSLMAWRGYGEVEPYYCEGLIHLELLYRSGMVDFDGIWVSVENGAYGELKRLYEETYGELALHYLQKREAGEFLERFALKTRSHYMPVTEEVKRFVIAYCDRYAEIGQKIAKIG